MSNDFKSWKRKNSERKSSLVYKPCSIITIIIIIYIKVYKVLTGELKDLRMKTAIHPLKIFLKLSNYVDIHCMFIYIYTLKIYIYIYLKVKSL